MSVMRLDECGRALDLFDPAVHCRRQVHGSLWHAVTLLTWPASCRAVFAGGGGKRGRNVVRPHPRPLHPHQPGDAWDGESSNQSAPRICASASVRDPRKCMRSMHKAFVAWRGSARFIAVLLGKVPHGRKFVLSVASLLVRRTSVR